MSVEIIQGDCREVLKGLSSGSIHCCVTSPPFWGLRDYGHPEQLGLERNIIDYVSNMVTVFREVRRVLRPDGTLWLNLGDSYVTGAGKVGDCPGGGYEGERWNGYRGTRGDSGLKPKDLAGLPWRVAFALQDDGWWLRSDIIWAKPNPMPESVQDRPTRSHEYIFLLTKSERYFYDADAIAEPSAYGPERAGTKGVGEWNKLPPETGNGRYGSTLHRSHPTRNKRTVWPVLTEPLRDAHFAAFPQLLVEPCILAGTSEKGCCSECGAPLRRVTERYRTLDGERRDDLGAWAKPTDPRRPSADGIGHRRKGTEIVTQGWEPTCSHAAPIAPCAVLDPFAGSGTTGIVALKHRRNAILIELNPEYVELCKKRLDGVNVTLTLEESVS